MTRVRDDGSVCPRSRLILCPGLRLSLVQGVEEFLRPWNPGRICTMSCSGSYLDLNCLLQVLHWKGCEMWAAWPLLGSVLQRLPLSPLNLICLELIAEVRCIGATCFTSMKGARDGAEPFSKSSSEDPTLFPLPFQP